jgi:hypothetical protein
MKASRVLVVALFLLGVGCSDSGAGTDGTTGTLDCAWLASDNCLKANFVDGMACVAPTTETGVLSADNKTCTYPSGVTITFDSPLQLPLPTDAPPAWHFAISEEGTECLRYDSADNDNFKLVVYGDAVTQTLPRPPGTTLTITCPDGDAYSTSNALSLLSCDPSGLISEGWGGGDTGANLDLYLYGANLPPLTMFNCTH